MVDRLAANLGMGLSKWRAAVRPDLNIIETTGLWRLLST